MIINAIYRFVGLTLMILINNEQSVHVQGAAIDLTTCTPMQSNFYIQVIDMGATPAEDRIKEAFQTAAERWQAVIVGDLEGYKAGYVGDWFAGTFSKSYNGAVDDVVIGYEIATIDGAGGMLGNAGAVYQRTKGSGKGTTISGVMQFDADDFAKMTTNDARTIILHGKLWTLLSCTCIDCVSVPQKSNASNNVPPSHNRNGSRAWIGRNR